MIYISLFGCLDQKKANVTMCSNENNISYKYDSLKFLFASIKQKKDLKTLRIYLVKKGQKIPILYTISNVANAVNTKAVSNLNKSDTILLFFNQNKYHKIYNFENVADYGGKNFLGCIIGSCTVNGKKMGLIDHSIITIP